MTKKIKQHVWHKRSGTMIPPKLLTVQEGKKGAAHEAPSAQQDARAAFAKKFSAAIKNAAREK